MRKKARRDRARFHLWMSKDAVPVLVFQPSKNLLPALLLAQLLALLIALTGFFSEALSHKVTKFPHLLPPAKKGKLIASGMMHCTSRACSISVHHDYPSGAQQSIIDGNEMQRPVGAL